MITIIKQNVFQISTTHSNMGRSWIQIIFDTHTHSHWSGVLYLHKEIGSRNGNTLPNQSLSQRVLHHSVSLSFSVCVYLPTKKPQTHLVSHHSVISFLFQWTPTRLHARRRLTLNESPRFPHNRWISSIAPQSIGFNNARSLEDGRFHRRWPLLLRHSFH